MTTTDFCEIMLVITYNRYLIKMWIQENKDLYKLIEWYTFNQNYIYIKCNMTQTLLKILYLTKKYIVNSSAN